MRSTTKYEVGNAIAWLLIGLTVLPLVAANADARGPADAAERLAWLLAQHDVRELINMPPAERADCSASVEEDKR